MYARHYPSVLAAAEKLARDHARLLKRILAWQQVVYTDEKLPVWLRESLVNVLYMITEDGLWAQAKPPLPAWAKPEDGLFGMNECPRGCPQIECIPCSFYGNQPLVYFFPELALSTCRGYKGYQFADGAPPWIFGGCTGNTAPIDFASPTRGYQFATNGISLAAMVDRYFLCYPAKRQGVRPRVLSDAQAVHDLDREPAARIRARRPDHRDARPATSAPNGSKRRNRAGPA